MTEEPNDSTKKPTDDDLKWSAPDPSQNPGTSNEDPPSPQLPNKEPDTYRMSFTGTAGEYFRIWIVNLFLSIITLGLYLPWAKIRQRKYLYGNTWMGEDSFGFHANPVALLKGYLILYAGVLLFSLGEYFNPIISIAVLVVYVLGFPFLVWKAIRFRAHYSSYRNIRFRFRGELSEAYLRYMLWPILIPFTFGLIIPYLAYLKKDYLIRFMSFGDQNFGFRGDGGRFYPPYLMSFGLGIVGYIAMGLAIFIPIPLLEFVDLPEGLKTTVMVTAMVIGYVALIFAFAAAQALVFVKIQNYVWPLTNLGSWISFKSEYKLGDFLRIQLINGLAILFSFGLAIPWATIRKSKYVIEQLLVSVDKDQLENIIHSSTSDEAGIGDAAADYMDFEIGL